ncbi:NAD-dependent epimerase/dehydratase family protein [Patescibacteria group bacterium]|nr:NAD-dependent epimerase/dehydratase family protein [Patescibacteria group bacterium]
MHFNNVKIIVTGGAGFIGSHLVDALIERGARDVHVIDNLSTGKKEYVNPKAILHKLDIRDYDAIFPVFQGAQFVFHLAALARIQPSIQDPKTAHDINATGTLNILLASSKNKVRRVIYSASSSAYGNQTEMPLHEDMRPQPLNPYAAQKYFGEIYCRMFSNLYGLETVALRYFNVYGPRQPEEGPYATVIGIFLRQKKQREPMTVVPNGHQKRDYTHVRDVIRANLLAAESRHIGKGEIINIGTHTNHSVLDVAGLIGGPTVFIEPRLGEARETLANISKAKNTLAWEPQVGFEEGIEELKKLSGLV